MHTGRGVSRLLRVALAFILTLAMLPLPMFGPNTAEAWSTGSGYSQDENILRTVGVALPAKGVIDYATGDATRTEEVVFDTSYYTGQVNIGGSAGGDFLNLTAPHIARAYLLVRDTASERWVGLVVENRGRTSAAGQIDVLNGSWTAVRLAAFSLWGTGNKDAESNPRASSRTGTTDVTPDTGADFAAPVNLLTGHVAQYSAGAAPNTRGWNGITTGGTRITADGAAAIGFIGSCACGDNQNGRAQFLAGARLLRITGAADRTLVLRFGLTFATPQVSGPIEFWTGVESWGTETTAFAPGTGVIRTEARTQSQQRYDGWDRYATRTIGTKPQVGISSIPSGAVVGTITNLTVEAKDPEPGLTNGHEDIRAVSLILVAGGDWVELIVVHRRADSTHPTITDKNDGIHIVASNGRYNPPREPTTSESLSHAWLTLDQATLVEDGDNFRVSFPVTFKEAARGTTFRIYARVLDRELNSSGLVSVGTIRVQ